MDSTGSGVSADEEEKDEDEELAHDDDEEDEDEINHTQLPKEVVHSPSPSRRVQNTPVLLDANMFKLYSDMMRSVRPY